MTFVYLYQAFHFWLLFQAIWSLSIMTIFAFSFQSPCHSPWPWPQIENSPKPYPSVSWPPQLFLSLVLERNCFLIFKKYFDIWKKLKYLTLISSLPSMLFINTFSRPALVQTFDLLQIEQSMKSSILSLLLSLFTISFPSSFRKKLCILSLYFPNDRVFVYF